MVSPIYLKTGFFAFWESYINSGKSNFLLIFWSYFDFATLDLLIFFWHDLIIVKFSCLDWCLFWLFFVKWDPFFLLLVTHDILLNFFVYSNWSSVGQLRIFRSNWRLFDCSHYKISKKGRFFWIEWTITAIDGVKGPWSKYSPILTIHHYFLRWCFSTKRFRYPF